MNKWDKLWPIETKQDIMKQIVYIFRKFWPIFDKFDQFASNIFGQIWPTRLIFEGALGEGKPPLGATMAEGFDRLNAMLPSSRPHPGFMLFCKSEQ